MQAPSQEQQHEVGESTATIRAYGTNVLQFVVRGHLSVEVARLLMTVADRLIEEGVKVHTFNDWEAVTGYDLMSRVEMTRDVFENRNKFLSTHILVHSVEVALGVEVANIVLKNKIHLHRDRATFETALQRVLQQEERSTQTL